MSQQSNCHSSSDAHIRRALQYTPFVSCISAAPVASILPLPQLDIHDLHSSVDGLADLASNAQQIQELDDDLRQGASQLPDEMLQYLHTVIGTFDASAIHLKNYAIEPVETESVEVNADTSLGPFAAALLPRIIRPDTDMPSINPAVPILPMHFPTPPQEAMHSQEDDFDMLLDSSFNETSYTALQDYTAPEPMSDAVFTPKKSINDTVMTQHVTPIQNSQSHSLRTIPSPPETNLAKPSNIIRIHLEGPSAFEKLVTLATQIVESDATLVTQDTSSRPSTASSTDSSVKTWWSEKYDSQGHRCLNGDTLWNLIIALKKTKDWNAALDADREVLAKMCKIWIRSIMRAQPESDSQVESQPDASEKSHAVLTPVDYLNAVTASELTLHYHLLLDDKETCISEDTINAIVAVVKQSLKEVAKLHYDDPKPSPKKQTDSQDSSLTVNNDRTTLERLLQRLQSFLSIFVTMLDKSRSLNTAIAGLEYICFDVLFTSPFHQSPGTTNPLSILQNPCLDLLTGIFALYPDQRTFILEECFSYMAQLPTQKSAARSYRLPNGKALQPVSALFMRFIMGAGGQFDVGFYNAAGNVVEKEHLIAVAQDDEAEGVDLGLQAADSEKALVVVKDQLRDAHRSVFQCAIIVANLFMAKAWQNTTGQSMDNPYRDYLSLFVDDLFVTLGLPEWPSSCALLQQLIRAAILILDKSEESAATLGAAIDLLSTVQVRLLDFETKKRKQDAPKSRDGDDAEWQALLTDAKDIFPRTNLNIADFQGLYLLTENLWARLFMGSCVSPKHVLEFHVSQWSDQLVQFQGKAEQEQQESIEDLFRRMCAVCLSMPSARRSTIDNLDESQIGYLYNLVHLRSSLFQCSAPVLSRLIKSLESVHVTLRSKALRSLSQLAALDTTILQRVDVGNAVGRRISDPSVQVRDAALEIIGKYAVCDSAASGQYLMIVKKHVTDPGLAVRKRVLKLLSDVYSNSNDKTQRVEIAHLILQMTDDDELSVQKVAKKAVEDLIIPSIEELFTQARDTTSNWSSLSFAAKNKIRTISHTIVDIVSSEQNSALLFKDNVRQLMYDHNHKITPSYTVCLSIVGCLFDEILQHPSGDAESEISRHLLTVSVFAETNANLISMEQVRIIIPYLKGLKSPQDLELYHSVIVIIRRVMMTKKTMPRDVTMDVLGSSMTALTKVSTKTLDESVACICMCATILGDVARIITPLKSCLDYLVELRQKDDQDTPNESKCGLFLRLLGLIARYYSFDNNDQAFQDKFSKTGSVLVVYIADQLSYFARSQIGALQRIAVESLGNLCKGTPIIFRSQIARTVLQNSLSNNSESLNITVLSILEDYFALKSSVEGPTKDTKSPDVADLTGHAVKYESDGISTELMQYYKNDVYRFALGNNIILTAKALDVIDQVVLQGLTHPLESFNTIIALEASPDLSIRQHATRIHQKLYQKYASMIDPGKYMSGIRQMYYYQQQFVVDPQGFRDSDEKTRTSLLQPLYDLLQSDKKSRKRVLAQFIKSVDPEAVIEEVTHDILAKCASTVKSAKFMVELLIYLKFSALDDVLHSIKTMDQIVALSGSILLQNLEEHSNFTEEIALKALSLCFLLRGRRFLKQAYGLTEKRCQAYETAKLDSGRNVKPAILKVGSSSRIAWPDYDWYNEALDDAEGRENICSAFVNMMDEKHRTDTNGDDEDEDERQNETTAANTEVVDEMAMDQPVKAKVSPKAKKPSTKNTTKHTRKSSKANEDDFDRLDTENNLTIETAAKGSLAKAKAQSIVPPARTSGRQRKPSAKVCDDNSEDDSDNEDFDMSSPTQSKALKDKTAGSANAAPSTNSTKTQKRKKPASRKPRKKATK